MSMLNICGGAFLAISSLNWDARTHRALLSIDRPIRLNKVTLFNKVTLLNRGFIRRSIDSIAL